MLRSVSVCLPARAFTWGCKEQAAKFEPASSVGSCAGQQKRHGGKEVTAGDTSTSLGKGQILGSNSLFKLSLISRQGKETPPGKNRLFKWSRGEINRCILAPLKPDPVTFPARV